MPKSCKNPMAISVQTVGEKQDQQYKEASQNHIYPQSRTPTVDKTQDCIITECRRKDIFCFQI